MLELGCALDPGRKRIDSENQDALGIFRPGIFRRRPPLLVVADGMGGYKGGAIASQLVVQGLSTAYLNARRDLPPLHALQMGVHMAHKSVQERADADPSLAQMGSTVVAAVVKNDKIFLVNVGDSRAYLVNRASVHQISYDHSLVAEQLRLGIITEEQMHTHPQRNVLSMSISGQRERLEMFSGMFVWQPGDLLVLCSDGLWGPVCEDQIQAVVLELPPQQAAQKLVQLANANHGPDNISVIVARYS